MPSWNAPTEEDLRVALEDWNGPDGITTKDVTVELIDETSRHPAPEVNGIHPAYQQHGTHYICTAQFYKGEEWIGNARARYRADGVAYIEQFSLVEDYQRKGIVTAHFNAMLSHYAEWGLNDVQVYVPAAAGKALMESLGLETADAPDTYRMDNE